MYALDLLIYGLTAALTVTAYLRAPGLPAQGPGPAGGSSRRSCPAWWARSS
jgi:hypothetical protein